MLGAAAPTFTALWNARAETIPAAPVFTTQAPVASHKMAVLTGVSVPSRPPAIRTLPLSSAVTVAPLRAAKVLLLSADQVPEAAVNVAVGTNAAGAPAALLTWSE